MTNTEPFPFQMPPPAHGPDPLINFGHPTPPVERKKRGPSRKIKPPTAESVPKNKGGRPRKIREIGKNPLLAAGYGSAAPAFRLQDLIGLQAEDVKPLMQAYSILFALEPAHRNRVLGLLTKVLA